MGGSGSLLVAGVLAMGLGPTGLEDATPLLGSAEATAVALPGTTVMLGITPGSSGSFVSSFAQPLATKATQKPSARKGWRFVKGRLGEVRAANCGVG
jgi:hypothetical protein